MESHHRFPHPSTISMKLVADAAELGRLLAQTDPHRYPGLAVVEESAVSASSLAEKIRGAIVPADSILAQQLRGAIESSGLTAYAIAQRAGVDSGILYRFIAGERDLTLETASRIAVAVGMRFTKPRKGRTKPE